MPHERNVTLRRTVVSFLLGLGLTLSAGCKEKPVTSPASGGQTATVAPARGAPVAEVPLYTYDVVNVWPHDPHAFTQGLVFHKGILLESTGLNGRSSLRKVDLSTGRVLEQVRLSAQYFAEGMTVLDNRIFQLTWQNRQGFVYRLETLEREKEFAYEGEGWGLTTDGHSLIMSDGTNRIRFMDPHTFQVTRTIEVWNQGQPLAQLNELEYVKGEIFANIWQTPAVARIDPATGKLLGLIDFSGLLAPGDRSPETDVLNGLAYDAAGDRLFVTGKNWPKLFEVRLKSK